MTLFNSINVDSVDSVGFLEPVYGCVYVSANVDWIPLAPWEEKLKAHERTLHLEIYALTSIELKSFIFLHYGSNKEKILLLSFNDKCPPLFDLDRC